MTQDKIIISKLCVLTVAVWSAVWLSFGNQPAPVVQANQNQAATPKSAVNDKLVWLDNYQAALAEAKKTGKPIFLEFRCAP